MEKREIKFRAFQDNQMLISPISSNYGLTRFFGLLYEDAPVMQYTGLKDKNGKEIYEGDLLRQPPQDGWEEKNYACHEVFFHDGDANSDYNIGYSLGRTRYKGALCGGHVPSFKPKTVANLIIIGNIYENPNLINE